MKHLILLRHGQSEWNLENRFTGWTDVELSKQGMSEAEKAGELIARSGILPKYCFTSYLRRAIHTLNIALGAMDRDWVPVVTVNTPCPMPHTYARPKPISATARSSSARNWPEPYSSAHACLALTWKVR